MTKAIRSFTLDVKLLNEITELAREEGKSVNGMVTELLKKGLKEHKREKVSKEVREEIAHWLTTGEWRKPYLLKHIIHWLTTGEWVKEEE